MHQTPSVVKWKVPSPPVSTTSINGFHIRVKDSNGATFKEFTVPVGTPDADGFFSAPLNDLSDHPYQSLTVTVASTSARAGESAETSSAPFTVTLVVDAPDSPVSVTVG